MSLALRIKEARQNKGLTQYDLASLTGIRQQMISKLERGLTTKTSYILVLANVLDVDPEWLSGIKEEPGLYANNKHKPSNMKTVLQFLLLHCVEILESKKINEQLDFIEHCLKQVKKTKNSKNHKQVLLECLAKLEK